MGERERERERKIGRETGWEKEIQGRKRERERYRGEISIGKNKEYKKEKIF